jgi:phospholipase/carboxylesterase
MTITPEFHHVFKPGTSTLPPVLLLHGTGGNEHDLLGLAESIAPGRSLLSVRGKVLENGMPRFFKRFAEGKFDEDDIRLRAAELAAFVRAAQGHYGITAPIALGYSNGANIAAALLVLDPSLLAGAVLLRAMAPFKEMPNPGLPGTPVLLLSGQVDQMIPLAEANRLVATLQSSGAKVSQHILPTGHGLTQSDLAHMTRYFSGEE